MFWFTPSTLCHDTCWWYGALNEAMIQNWKSWRISAALWLPVGIAPLNLKSWLRCITHQWAKLHWIKLIFESDNSALGHPYSLSHSFIPDMLGRCIVLWSWEFRLARFQICNFLHPYIFVTTSKWQKMRKFFTYKINWTFSSSLWIIDWM